MGIPHCALENGADLHVNERQKIRHYCARSTEERRRRRIIVRLHLRTVLGQARALLTTVPGNRARRCFLYTRRLGG